MQNVTIQKGLRHTAPNTHITAATIRLYKQPMKMIDMLSLRENSTPECDSIFGYTCQNNE